MAQKWNLQDIRPAEPKRRKPPREEATPPPEPTYVDREDPDAGAVRVVNGTKRNRRTIVYAFIIFFVVVGGAFLLSYLSSGAELVVNPRYREPNVNATITAYNTPQEDELTYEIMSLEASGERQVSATGQETVVEQAEGTITVNNEHSTEPIRLITNTRFESPEGLVFRLVDSIVVPGYTRNEQGEIVPGTITAAVFADEPGEEYNIGPSRFTIPGFAGAPEFENVYGESTEQMTGGFDGERFIIDEAELQTAQQSLRLELRNSLLERIDEEKPAGFAVFQGATTFTYETLPAVEYGDDLATIKEQATLRIPIFAEPEFAAYIADSTVPGYEGAPVRIDDLSVLTFSYTSATTSSSNIAAVDSLEFNLVGRPLIIWEYDVEALTRDLAGKNRTALPSVLGGYPSIERAEAETRPFWTSSFPEDPADIEVEEVLAPRE